MAPESLQPHSDASQAKDFTRLLPFHLSASILGLLDQKSLDACCAVNGRWELLVRRLQEDQQCRSAVQRNLLQLQELCPGKAIPNYAKRVRVQIPQLDDEGEVIEVKEKQPTKRSKSKTASEDFSLHEAYRELKTLTIELEERNVFCGPYKTHVLLEHSDRRRRAHYSGGDRVAVASANRRVRLLRVPGGEEEPLLLQGSAGPLRALCLREDRGLLLGSTSSDLGIRCWHIPSGACVRSLEGHLAPVTCLDCRQDSLVSGAADGVVKVWSLESGKCLRTLMHSSPVWAVRTDGTHVVSAGHRGLVKVWSAQTGALIKTLERHQGPVLCLSFDQWHLVTGSSDGYALGWSMLGKFRRCLIAFFHPKEVLSLEFLYLRVVSGCADGRVRIFSFLAGTCLRVLEPSGDPVSALYVAGNRLVTNSPSRLLLLQFQDVLWDYSLPADRELLKKDKKSRKDKSPKSRQTPKSRGRPKSAEAHQSPAPPAPEEAEATWEHELPQRDPSRPMSPDKFLLTISTLQSSCKAAAGSPGLPAGARRAQQQQQQQQQPRGQSRRAQQQQQQQEQPWGVSRRALQQQQQEQQPRGVSRRALQQQQEPWGVSRRALQQQQEQQQPRGVSRRALQQQQEQQQPRGVSRRALQQEQQQPGEVSRRALQQQEEQQQPWGVSRRALQQQQQQEQQPRGVSRRALQQQQQQEQQQPWGLSRRALQQQQQQQQPRGVSRRALQQQQQQAARLQRARLHSHSLSATKSSVPLGAKPPRLGPRSSLHSPTGKSSSPAPCLLRPKFCGSLGERKTPSGRGKGTPGPKDGDQLMDPCTAPWELLHPRRGALRIQPRCPQGSRGDSELRLLPAAPQQEPASRNARLRKERGLPADSPSGERKAAAPGVGHDTSS